MAYRTYQRNLSKGSAAEDMLMPYVNRHYCRGGNYKRCLLAAFEMHTETMSAWTMVATAVISIIVFIPTIVAVNYSAAALLPFAALTAAVLIHMPFSVGNHLFCCISAEVHSLWRRLDQIFMFVASVPLTFALSWHVYDSWVGIAVSTGVAAALAVQGVRQVRCVQAQHKWERLQLFMLVYGAAMSIALPIARHTIKDLAQFRFTAASAYGVGAVAVFHLGGWIFANSFPEKHFPGCFDLVGNSHQLMHVTITGTIVLLYMFVWQLHKQSVSNIA